jgi:UDP-N-acetylmuramoylalanine--D-glutamate ligase
LDDPVLVLPASYIIKAKPLLFWSAVRGPDQTSCAAQLRAEGIQVELGIPLDINSFEPWRSDLTAVVIGPGIPWDHPTLEILRQEGVQVRGEIELAWEALNDIPWVGITGTNGKTTVTHLLSHVLEQAGLRAPMGGNMGVSAAGDGAEHQNGGLA